jgi:hypothetical protein
MVRYLVYLPFNLAFVLLAFILSPFLAALSMLTGPVLPGFLQWFSTTDDTLDGGQHQHPEIYHPVRGFKLWWQRTCWICRNPAHGWQSRVLGFLTEGHTVISETTTNDGPYFTTKTIMQDAKGRRYFSWRSDQKRFGMYVKIWIGWNPRAYDGVGHGYEFQPFMVKRIK